MSLLRVLVISFLAIVLAGSHALGQPSRVPTPMPGAAPPSDDEAVDEEAQDEDQEVEQDSSDVEKAPSQPQRPPPRMQRRVQERGRPQPRLDQRQRVIPGAPRPGPVARQPQQPRSQPVVRKTGDGTIPPLEDLTETRQRPLFSTTRRPPEPEEAEEAAAPITEGGSMPFELVGVVIGEDVNAAIFRNTDSKEETRVTKGDKIGNWSLEEVAARAVVLRGRDKRVRMRLFDEASAPGIQVGKVSGESEQPEEADAAPESDEEVDEDIAPASSPQAKPATAQPKPPPSVRSEQQRRRRAGRPNRGNQPPNAVRD